MISLGRKEVADMMTIKEFASLCNCNTQTLRYYDKIDLLRPVKVDQWSGYRYYEESHAIDFIKIKNLQAADFTIRK
jgi:DNA-binding transcriptional MerR regulator